MIKQILLILLSVLLLWGCRQPAPKNQKPVVMVSILPQKTFVEKMAGDLVKVSVLIPPGANPSTYSLLPVQMEDISGAAIWFKMGHVGFELSWAEKIYGANSAMKVIDLSEQLPLITGNPGEEHAAPTGIDPHTWLSPSLVKMMATRMKDELINILPSHSDEIGERYLQFISSIDSTDREIRNILAGKEGKTFISFHPSLSYFAREYGLVQLSLEQGGKEPTPAHMAFLARTAREMGIKSIFIQSDFDRELARVFSEEVGGTIIHVTPLSPDWSANLTDIARLISENL